jgi:hypothetical protein
MSADGKRNFWLPPRPDQTFQTSATPVVVVLVTQQTSIKFMKRACSLTVTSFSAQRESDVVLVDQVDAIVVAYAHR